VIAKDVKKMETTKMRMLHMIRVKSLYKVRNEASGKRLCCYRHVEGRRQDRNL